MRAPRRIVIVGNGIAGLTAADTLRTVGHDGELTLIGDELHRAYSRPALSKSLLRDEQDPNGHLLPPPTHSATELLGVRATRLDPGRRTVVLDDGDRLPYDALIIATGCRARRLGFADVPDNGSGSLSLRTIEDAWQLRSRIAERPSVVVVGGGPLGMEIASACIEGGCEVALVSQGPPLEQQLGSYLSDVFVGAARARGLRIVTTTGARLIRSGPDTRVMMANGRVLEAGLVVVAVGDQPNVEWLADSGLLDADGVLAVDDRGRVRPDIVAAGDVAAVPTPRGLRRVPLWSAAIEHAKVAASSLLLGDEARPVSALPYFWTEQFGVSLKAVGHLPLVGIPTTIDGDQACDRHLLRWAGAGLEAAAAINYRIPIPRLRRLCDAVA